MHAAMDLLPLVCEFVSESEISNADALEMLYLSLDKVDC